MRSNAKIIIFLVTLALIVVLVIFSTTVLTVSSITVANQVQSALIVDKDIITSSGIKPGNSIIGLNEKKIIENIEKNNSYIKVTNIERGFPNKITIYVNVRTPIMRIAIEDSSSYAVVDSSLKVLKVLSALEAVSSGATSVSGVLVSNDGGQATSIVGKRLSVSEEPNSILYAITTAAVAMDLDDNSFLAFFKEIDFNQNGKVYITCNTGVALILDPELEQANITYQLRMCMETYNALDTLSERRNSGYIYFNGQYFLWNEVA